MCGIAGQFGKVTKDFASKALAALQHRGPDGQGVWESELATLVHTRLAILDLSEGGSQPMHVAESGLTIVFNGEIYNFRELRAELEREGVVFHSQSDTEVLLRLYQREGEAMTGRLRGMFAFALWDARKRRAFLARDPFGIKPLYYSFSGGTLSFASELRVLQKTGCAGSKLDAAALMGFFETGSVAEPRTLLEGVRCLPAGHQLTWRDGQVQERRFWSLQFGGEKVAPADSVQMTRAALLDSVEHHFVSDVPVGLFLSGGVDSTALLALAHQTGRRELSTFSIGVDDEGLDESSIAARTAAHFGARHHELRLNASALGESFPRFLSHMDQPSIDGFNTFSVAGFAREHGMKVVLSGLGGDEMFGGYPSFERVPRLAAMARLTHRIGLAGPAGPLLEKHMPRLPMRRVGSLLQREATIPHAYRAFRGVFTRKTARELAARYAGCDVNEVPDDPSLGDVPEGDARDQVSACELSLYMRNQLLKDSDVMSMAHGLELRVPLVDRVLFESVAGIPAAERLRPGKQLLLEAVPEVPEWVANQPKRGFLFPFEKWLSSEWGGAFADVTRRLPEKHPTWYQRWSAFMLERWIER
ncbi:asparagine synthase (glutamine-hydrolyzing) [Prosthecobacter sp.]|uniref:asparagine synthase (glutamine-hydrolyzing) n=1 Tax=Prosthecobacter sp. TaxID=1965333 RepID=UPI001DDBDEE6|nr:asparagine synthase (glutamine-hydrolyzing) [Prosthecobacter sp.]MCB1275579.1 asparagine synthase (glutamine-hydrolyzing) [Prosthecobacter sp.]